MKHDCAQQAAEAPEAAGATTCIAGRMPATPDEIVRFRLLLEQALATPTDETEDESEDEGGQRTPSDGMPRGGREPFGAGTGRRDANGQPAASRTVLSDSSAFASYRAGPAQPEARRRTPALQLVAEPSPQGAAQAGRPATAGADMVRDLVAEILFAIELPDRRHAIGLGMQSALLPGTRICLTMSDDELSVLLQTHSEPVYRDALVHRSALVQALVRRCARAVVVEIEFDA